MVVIIGNGKEHSGAWIKEEEDLAKWGNIGEFRGIGPYLSIFIARNDPVLD